MKTTVRVEGLRELDKALGELPKSTARSVLRRVLLKAAEPMKQDMIRLAPKDKHHLERSIVATTRRPKGEKAASTRAYARARAMGLSASEARAAAKAAGGGPVEVFVGPGRNPQGIFQEFGTVHHPPQPFVRPAWDQNKDGILDSLKSDLWTEIRKSAERLARKRAREAAKGK